MRETLFPLPALRVDAIIADYIPEFERANQGLVARYGEALND